MSKQSVPLSDDRAARFSGSKMNRSTLAPALVFCLAPGRRSCRRSPSGDNGRVSHESGIRLVDQPRPLSTMMPLVQSGQNVSRSVS
jgi:hypothetical protein